MFFENYVQYVHRRDVRAQTFRLLDYAFAMSRARMPVLSHYLAGTPPVSVSKIDHGLMVLPTRRVFRSLAHRALPSQHKNVRRHS